MIERYWGPNCSWRFSGRHACTRPSVLPLELSTWSRDKPALTIVLPDLPGWRQCCGLPAGTKTPDTMRSVDLPADRLEGWRTSPAPTACLAACLSHSSALATNRLPLSFRSTFECVRSSLSAACVVIWTTLKWSNPTILIKVLRNIYRIFISCLLHFYWTTFNNFFSLGDRILFQMNFLT